jgi:hypothetical protein
MKRNLKTLSIIIKNEVLLNRIKTTPTLNSLVPNANNLVVGCNTVNVNHFTYNKLLNSQFYGLATVVEIN